ncbi:hypothetical protein MHC_02545 [Mycoplasma haemocanis str. Illinois]|uniref:Uncharacterized protein n=1 Tax=Mycoplasma haemocanis (strain Illinois) TaxID=1111676 RepID=H6N6V1_MYCHN|nr:hypothetical protein [Mycoplasma haemocanis]AEW45373.1 hypothetical protein MHC_02545 [Mycoplasma haemocanis str. Illinois]
MSNSPQNWLSLNLKNNLLVGISGLSIVGTGSGAFFGGASKDIGNSFSTAADPIAKPITKGYESIATKVKEFQAKGYNKGLDLKEWVDGNFKKSRIKSGWNQIKGNVESWGKQVYEIVKEIKNKAGDFIKNWDDSKQTLHVIFNALGSSASIVGSLFGTWDTSGESKLMLLWEALQKEEFSEFLTHVSTLASKNPNLLSELQSNDIPDILNAFKQEPGFVVEKIKELSQKEEKVTRDILINSLKLQSLMGKAKAIGSRVQSLISQGEKAKDEIEKVKKELQDIIKQLEAMISANSSSEQQQ